MYYFYDFMINPMIIEYLKLFDELAMTSDLNY